MGFEFHPSQALESARRVTGTLLPERRIYGVALGLYLFSQVADISTTYASLQIGMEELNPLLGGIHERAGLIGMAAFKTTIASLALGVIECRRLRKGYRGPLLTLGVVGTVTFGAALSNASKIAELYAKLP